MSKDGVYPSSIHFLSFMEDVELEVEYKDQIMGVDMTRCSIGEVRGMVQVFQISLHEFRIRIEVRGYDVLPGFYRMSKNGFYPSSIQFLAFMNMSSSKWNIKIKLWGLICLDVALGKYVV